MPADTIANKYHIVREIARSNDVVYEATDTTSGRRVALKELVLPGNLTPQARKERIERFNREARAAGRLSHRNIVSVYDYGVAEGRYFIAMEYLEGQTLRESLQARGALPIPECIEIACQVLAALSHAHSHRVIHRDVKPDNISILPGGIVKLTDFGIARLTEEASLTGDGQVFGTPSYMSPEQIEGGHVDYRTDLFSMGIVLYEMLVGRKPFTGDSVVSITYSIMHHEPPAMDGIPLGLESVVMRALSKDPVRRPTSAAEMSQQLQSADLSGALDRSAAGSPGMGYFGSSATASSSGLGGVSVPPVFAPAPWLQQPAPAPPLPFSVPPTPAPQAAPASGTPVVGPFATWGTAAQPATPAGAPPSIPTPHVRRHAGVGQETRTFFAALMWGMCIAAIVVGFILLFLRAFEQHRLQGADLRVQQLANDGKSYADRGQLEQSAASFAEAVRAGGKSKAARDARTSLATVYYKIGVNAYQAHDYEGAEKAWNQVLDVLSVRDIQTTEYEQGLITDTNHNLSMLYQVSHGAVGAPRAQDGSSGGSSPDDDTALYSRFGRAQESMQRAQALYQKGDVSGAREEWQKVVAEAPGTSLADQAQQSLNQSATPPSF